MGSSVSLAQPKRTCPNACSVSLAAEEELARHGVTGPFLGGFQETLGIVPVKPDDKFTQLTERLMTEAARHLAKKLHYKEDESTQKVFIRLLLLLQTLQDKPLDLIAASYLELLEQGAIELCPGRCGRRAIGGQRWRQSVQELLAQKLSESPMRITAMMSDRLRFEIFENERVSGRAEFTTNLFTSEAGLLEIAWVLMEMVRRGGYTCSCADKRMKALIDGMIDEAKTLYTEGQVDAAKVVERKRRTTRSLKKPGLLVDGELRAWSNIYNLLLTGRLARMKSYLHQ